jgi:hypothetical protein
MKQLIEDYKKKIETLANDLRLYKSTGSINDIKKVERLTTKLFEYRAFVTELERALSNKQNILNDLNDLALYRKENVQVDNSDDLGREDKTNSPDNNNTNSIVQVNFPDFIARVDFSTLRTQKKSLIEMIDDMEKKNAEYYYNELSDLNGILNLIDSIQDFACDVMGLNPIDVFDFELEESREDVTKTITLCKECNTDDVTIKVKNSGYCMICGKEVETYKATLKATAKVIGYQVLGMAGHENDGQLHPEMSASFCLYSLKQARKMLSSDNTMYTNEWVIVSIWSGDIEEPTFMFHGNPDNNHKK